MIRTFLGLAAVAALAAVGMFSAPADAAALGHHLSPATLPAIALGGLIVNRESLTTLYTSFSASFQGGLGQVQPQWQNIAMRVPASTKTQEYGWLGKFPNVREWIGERVIHNMTADAMKITEKKWEQTVSVDRDDIETDNLGLYSPMFTELGRSGAAWPDQVLWPMLAAGFSTACYDGQYFFDTDHPVLDADGVEQSVANTDAGSGTAWYLLDTGRVYKPLIWQVRRELANLIRFDRDTDENVFMRNEFIYGADARANAGYGFWQMAWGSKQTLDSTHYATARAALLGMKGDYGRPLGLLQSKPLLIVPPSLETNAMTLINAERDSGGATNIWRNTATVLVTPWLA